eukprot:365248-Chlamydomonas_euryale.AAC.6
MEVLLLCMYESVPCAVGTCCMPGNIVSEMYLCTSCVGGGAALGAQFRRQVASVVSVKHPSTLARVALQLA